MRGTVALINEEDAMVLVETEHGEYSVLGIMDEEGLSVGDVIVGDLEKLDFQVMQNETRGVQVSVYVEDTELPLEEAKSRMD